MITMYKTTTNEPVWSSNSIIGIVDILLMNWGNDPNFALEFDEDTMLLTVNNTEYLLKYVAFPTNRGELVDEWN